MISNSSEKSLAATSLVAQAHCCGGLNFRDLAQHVGIRAASIYHHFPGNAHLAAAVSGAQLIARSRADIALYHALIVNYRIAGLLPA